MWNVPGSARDTKVHGVKIMTHQVCGKKKVMVHTSILLFVLVLLFVVFPPNMLYGKNEVMRQNCRRIANELE